MPNTSSYRLSGIISRNQACFSFFNRQSNINLEDRAIIIEKYKFFNNSLELTLEYLEDLKEMGFNYDKLIVEKDYIAVNCTGLPVKKSIAFGMAVRYLWEGANCNQTPDQFHLVVKTYFDIKEKLPDYNKLEMLCLACNYAITQFTGYYNCNHFFSNSNGCKIISSVDEIHENKLVNESFASKSKNNNPKHFPHIRGGWDREKYINFYNFLKK